MNSKYLVALFAAAAFAQPAFAAEGARVEVRTGLDRVNIEASYDDGVDAFSGEDHDDGLLYGAELGYDVKVGNFTLGAYAGLDFSTTDYCTEIYGEDKGCLKAGRNITLGVRAGFPLSATSTVYAKGGYSNGRITARYEDFENILEDFKGSANRDGFHLGAGAEFALGGKAYGKVEYVYTDYDSFNAADGGLALGIDASRHQLVTGIGLRF
jgi:outer membrane immunogenic protein